ncbi:hypothetical protein DNU06_09800 [Putridiphycobacter roseus]|uniref:Sulfatase-modifying factor enzyme-like domain-containing protein n=1 Tax=Putridiphycobacter roseus TaxID=2219161 RepID=A0A2W1ND53_9FLAO|nr:SUMF1/EgtB/PvdO family nonheme iron enzyme [Putridiphycobacter roseus]PZE17033.1 hypothetical protein DNU06_09800 [Putridiphycobacter roseus]
MKNFTIVGLTVLCVAVFSFQGNQVAKFQKKTGFEFIPSGALEVDGKTNSIAAFMMLNHEVTNAEYRQFIKEAYLAQGDLLGAEAMLPDTNAWKDTSKLNGYNGFMDPFANLYYSHPAYQNYPVVNVSVENAQAYCVWLGKKLAAAFPDYATIQMRLPLKEEWIYAAKGGLKSSPYPWGGPYVRDSKGTYLANFYTVGEHNITRDEKGGPKIISRENYRVSPINIEMSHFSLAVAKSYLPNGYGLYNMAGNAAELVVGDVACAMGGHWLSYGYDIQVTSAMEFYDPNPFVGFRPVFTYSKKTKN